MSVDDNNMADYIDLSVRAHAAGGPAELAEQLFEEGFAAGSKSTAALILVVAGATAVAGAATAAAIWPTVKARAKSKLESEKVKAVDEALARRAAEEVAAARRRRVFTTATEFELFGAGQYTLRPGDGFRVLTRDGDVVQVRPVGDASDEMLFASGAALEAASDFSLAEIDSL